MTWHQDLAAARAIHDPRGQDQWHAEHLPIRNRRIAGIDAHADRESEPRGGIAVTLGQFPLAYRRAPQRIADSLEERLETIPGKLRLGAPVSRDPRTQERVVPELETEHAIGSQPV